MRSLLFGRGHFERLFREAELDVIVGLLHGDFAFELRLVQSSARRRCRRAGPTGAPVLDRLALMHGDLLERPSLAGGEIDLIDQRHHDRADVQRTAGGGAAAVPRR